MSLNPTGTTNANWNYSNPNKPNYSQTLIGTVVALQEIQKRKFLGPGQYGAPEFWPEGRPKMNQRMTLATPDGSLVSFIYQPASNPQKKEDKGIHLALFHLTGDTDMNNLIGKTIQIDTWDMVNNAGTPIKYGAGNPRPFTVYEMINGNLVTFGDAGDPNAVNTEALASGPYSLSYPLPAEYSVPELLANDAASGGQVINHQQAVAPQNIQVPVQQAQPVVQQQPQQFVSPEPIQQVQQVQQQPVAQMQPMMQQPAGQVNAVMPAGMNQQVAAAMQQVEAQGAGAVYDEDIPF